MNTTPRPTILVLDDDPGVVDFLCESLEERGFATTGVTSPKHALALIQHQTFDLVVTDVEMPEMRGPDLLQAILADAPSQLVLLITAFGSVELAVAMVRAGACDFLAKPFKIESLVYAIERAFRDREARREIVRLRSVVATTQAGPFIARSPAMQKALATGQRAASSDCTVLLTGETGTGKSALARYIHDASARQQGPFMAVNCASLPLALVESELFGVRRGAFTDAREDRAGAFVAASGGTLFLDEIGELPLEVQAKLLQALESGTVRPLGTTSSIPFEARLIAATNRPLEEMLRDGSFRADLYYRLNVVRIEVPPLRSRHEDIVPLVDHFVARAADRLHRAITGVSTAAMRRLIHYPWPGNVRELANIIERAVALGEHETIVPEDLDFGDNGWLQRDVTQWMGQSLPLHEVERVYVRKILDSVAGNKAAAARILGINRRTLYRKMNP